MEVTVLLVAVSQGIIGYPNVFSRHRHFQLFESIKKLIKP